MAEKTPGHGMMTFLRMEKLGLIEPLCELLGLCNERIPIPDPTKIITWTDLRPFAEQLFQERNDAWRFLANKAFGNDGATLLVARQHSADIRDVQKKALMDGLNYYLRMRSLETMTYTMGAPPAGSWRKLVRLLPKAVSENHRAWAVQLHSLPTSTDKKSKGNKQQGTLGLTINVISPVCGSYFLQTVAGAVPRKKLRALQELVSKHDSVVHHAVKGNERRLMLPLQPAFGPKDLRAWAQHQIILIDRQRAQHKGLLTPSSPKGGMP